MTTITLPIAAVPAQPDALSHEQVCDILETGNPTDEECRLIRLGYGAAQVADLAAQGAAERAVPACSTCNDRGAVGNILTAEPCPDCTPAQTEHVAADVSKNGLESNMTGGAVPEPPRAYAGKERGAWEHGFNSGRASHAQAPAGAVELAEADRRAGAAERELVACKEDVVRFERVRDQMKDQWGVSRNVSFDVVWAEALALKATAQAAPAAGAVAGPDGMMRDELRNMIEGMSVSVDVSTGDHDAGHRYFGTVTEVMDCRDDKHGVTLLVQDAEPNFAPTPAAQADSGVQEDAALLDWLDADGGECVFHLGGTWYTRVGYGQPYRKRANLRAAIRAALAAKGEKNGN